MSDTGFKRIGTATAIPRGYGLLIPRGGYTGGGGEYGAQITNELRAFAILREPVAHRIVVRVAHDIFDNWFNIELKEGESEDFDQKIQEKLSTLKAKFEWTRLSSYERAFGWAIMVLGYKDEGKTLENPLKNPTELVDIHAYAPIQISSIKKDRNQQSNRYGLPEIYYIQREGIAARLKVHYTRVIHVATRLYETSDWEGRAVLDNFWDDLVTLRNIRWGMGQTMFRYGSGFPDLTFSGYEKTEIEDYVNSGAFAALNARTYFAHNDDVEMEFKGVAGRALDPMNYYLPIMENISCASGIPLAILRGVQAGALTGSQVNEREYFNIISDEQSAYEVGLRDLINIILQLEKKESEVAEIPDWAFNWKSGFELTEEQKAKIELDNLEAIRRKCELTKFTYNEVRKMIDPSLEELTEEQGGNDFVEIRGIESTGESYLVASVKNTRKRRKKT